MSPKAVFLVRLEMSWEPGTSFSMLFPYTSSLAVNELVPKLT